MLSSDQMVRQVGPSWLSAGSAIVLCTGCVSNPLPSEFRTIAAQASEAEIGACRRVEGAYSYHGSFIQRATEGIDPTAAVYILERNVRDEWQPRTFKVTFVNVDGNRVALALTVLGGDLSLTPLVTVTVEAWCVGGMIRIIDEQSGNSDGTPIAAWSVRDLAVDEKGVLTVEYNFSARSWLSGTDSGRAIVQFEPSGRH